MKHNFYFCFMKIDFVKMGVTTLGVSIAGIIAGLSLVFIGICFKIVKWFLLKLFGLNF